VSCINKASCTTCRDTKQTATFGPPLLSATAAHTSEPILEIGNDADGLLENSELGKRGG